jgi:hypothetical protein
MMDDPTQWFEIPQVDPISLARDLYPSVNHLRWGYAAAPDVARGGDQELRRDLAIEGDVVIARHLGLPGEVPALADPSALYNGDVGLYLDSALINAVALQGRYISSGISARGGGPYPAHSGPRQLSSDVRDWMFGQFHDHMAGYGAQALGQNVRTFGPDIHDGIWGRTGSRYLADKAAEAAVEGLREATIADAHARAEPHPQPLPAATWAPATGALVDAAVPDERNAPAATEAAPATGLRARRPAGERENWTAGEVEEWQSIGTQLGGLTARLETEGLVQPKWEFWPTRTLKEGETPEIVATKMDIAVTSRLDLDRGEPPEHLARVELIEQGSYAAYAHSAIRRGVDVAFPVASRLHGEAVQTIEKSFADGHSQEMQLQRLRREDVGFDI